VYGGSKRTYIRIALIERLSAEELARLVADSTLDSDLGVRLAARPSLLVAEAQRCSYTARGCPLVAAIKSIRAPRYSAASSR
jgi:hypothetical protein